MRRQKKATKAPQVFEHIFNADRDTVVKIAQNYVNGSGDYIRELQ